MAIRTWLTALCLIAFVVGCSYQPPADIPVVTGFDAKRYLGTWYEIARLDHRFERDMDHVTATYAPRTDGGIDVTNRGFDTDDQQWRDAIGKAYFVDSPETASLKVSFFGPFYGGYNVIDLDPEYGYALVCGPNREYLWILSRTPTLDRAVTERLVAKAQQYGFATDKLIWVDQSHPVASRSQGNTRRARS